MDVSFWCVQDDATRVGVWEPEITPRAASRGCVREGAGEYVREGARNVCGIPDCIVHGVNGHSNLPSPYEVMAVRVVST